VSASTPWILAALRLSSKKSLCHARVLGLRIDWPKQTEQYLEWQKSMSDYDQKSYLLLQDLSEQEYPHIKTITQY